MVYDVKITSKDVDQFDICYCGKEVATYTQITVEKLDLILSVFKAIGGSIQITTINNTNQQEE